MDQARKSRLKDHEKSLFVSLCQISQAINSSLETREVLTAMLDTALEVMGGERGFIMLGSLSGDLEVAVERMTGEEQDLAGDLAAQLKDDLPGEGSGASRSVIDQVRKTLEPVVSNDAPSDFDLSQSIRDLGIRSILCAPIKEEDELLGIIYLDTRISRGMFNDQDKEMLVALANQAAVALRNAVLYKKLQESYLGAVRCLANTIGAKDPYTRGHSMRVAAYAVLCAADLGLEGKGLQELEIAALLHDLGKLGVREEILLKPTNLTPDERREIEEHPHLGFDIVAPLNLPENIMLAILHHQERFDGKGYPDGLEGEEIPLYTRIIAVADAFDAMTSPRAYRPAMPRQAALDEISRCSGTQFDPLIVEAFLRVVEKESVAL